MPGSQARWAWHTHTSVWQCQGHLLQTLLQHPPLPYLTLPHLPTFLACCCWQTNNSSRQLGPWTWELGTWNLPWKFNTFGFKSQDMLFGCCVAKQEAARAAGRGPQRWPGHKQIATYTFAILHKLQKQATEPSRAEPSLWHATYVANVQKTGDIFIN